MKKSTAQTPVFKSTTINQAVRPSTAVKTQSRKVRPSSKYTVRGNDNTRATVNQNDVRSAVTIPSQIVPNTPGTMWAGSSHGQFS